MEMRAIKYVIATWQSPGTMFVTAQQFDGCYQEIPTGLTALGMTEKNRNMYRSPCHCEERSDVAIRSPIFGRFVNRPYDGQATLGPLTEGAGTAQAVTGGVSYRNDYTPFAPSGHLPQRGRQGCGSHSRKPVEDRKRAINDRPYDIENPYLAPSQREARRRAQRERLESIPV